MKRLSNAFSYIFSDNEWFNKVLVGGVFLLLIPFGIGMIMLNGFLLHVMTKQKNGEKEMPFWRNYRTVFYDGFRISLYSLTLIIVFYLSIFLFKLEFTIPSAIFSLTCFLTINTLFITKTLDIFSFVVSVMLLMTAISVGWMWIVVGWPLLIFLALLVQTHLFANTI